MFIQLDLGWMSHPFPLSSFRLSARADRDPALARADAACAGARRSDRPTSPRGGRRSRSRRATLEARPRRPQPPRRRAEAAAQRERRASARRAARGGAELRTPVRRGRAACRQVVRPDRQPTRSKASAQCQALTQAFLDKMLLGERDLSLRLLSEGAGDKRRAACHQRRRHLAADGPRLRHVGRRHARPRRRRAAARRRQGRAARRGCAFAPSTSRRRSRSTTRSTSPTASPPAAAWGCARARCWSSASTTSMPTARGFPLHLGSDRHDVRRRASWRWPTATTTCAIRRCRPRR